MFVNLDKISTREYKGWTRVPLPETSDMGSKKLDKSVR